MILYEIPYYTLHTRMEWWTLLLFWSFSMSFTCQLSSIAKKMDSLHSNSLPTYSTPFPLNFDPSVRLERYRVFHMKMLWFKNLKHCPLNLILELFCDFQNNFSHSYIHKIGNEHNTVSKYVISILNTLYNMYVCRSLGACRRGDKFVVSYRTWTTT